MHSVTCNGIYGLIRTGLDVFDTDVLSVSVEDLIHAAPAAKKKRGPASVLQRQIEQIGRMPRAKQKFITEMLDALIIQQQTAQG